MPKIGIFQKKKKIENSFIFLYFMKMAKPSRKMYSITQVVYFSFYFLTVWCLAVPKLLISITHELIIDFQIKSSDQ